MARNKRRHKFTIGYGHTYTSPNSRADFSELKYKLHSESLKSNAVEFTSDELSAAQRIEIKNNIRKSNKANTLKIVLLTIISVIVLIIIVIEMIEGVLSSH
ncbi:MAG: hypothetical protein ACSHXF_11460 [Aquaticitalea sp.]